MMTSRTCPHPYVNVNHNIPVLLKQNSPPPTPFEFISRLLIMIKNLSHVCEMRSPIWCEKVLPRFSRRNFYREGPNEAEMRYMLKITQLIGSLA